MLVGVPGTNLAAAMAAASTPAASSVTSPPSSPSTDSAPALAVTKYRCVADSTHPLFESLRINNNVMELQVANEFYESLIGLMFDMFRHCIMGNMKAKAVADKYRLDEYKVLFKLKAELQFAFCGQSDQEKMVRRSDFGSKTMETLKVSSIDGLLSSLYNERRWLLEEFEESKSDSQMLNAMMIGVSGSKDTRIYDFLSLRKNAGQEIVLDQVLESLSNYMKECEFRNGN